MKFLDDKRAVFFNEAEILPEMASIIRDAGLNREETRAAMPTIQEILDGFRRASHECQLRIGVLNDASNTALLDERDAAYELQQSAFMLAAIVDLGVGMTQNHDKGAKSYLRIIQMICHYAENKKSKGALFVTEDGMSGLASGKFYEAIAPFLPKRTVSYVAQRRRITAPKPGTA